MKVNTNFKIRIFIIYVKVRLWINNTFWSILEFILEFILESLIFILTGKKE